MLTAIDGSRITRRAGLALVAAVTLCACSKPDKYAAAEKLASSDVAAIAAAAHVSGEWCVSLAWDSARNATMATPHLLFATDPDDSLADAPYVSANSFQVEIGPPPSIVTHADPNALRKVAELSPRVEQALPLARAELKQLDRYARWKTEKWRYETRISVSASDGHVRVMFAPFAVTDMDVRIEIDPVARAVVKRNVHSE